MSKLFLFFSLDYSFFKKKILHTNYKFISNYNLILNKNFFFLDYFLVKFFFFFKKINNFNFNFRYSFRLKQLNWNFYKKNDNYKKNIFLNFYFYFNYGLVFFWKSIKLWILGLFFFLFFFYFLIYIRLLPFNKILFEVFLIIMFLYWLFSGFVFFIKRYQFSKYTTAIQRFWKRTYILFWLIESGVFVIFFYLTLNASEEPVFMYDQLKLYKTHLFSWRWFLQKLFIIVFMIIIGYFVLLNLKWNTFYQQSALLLALTLLLVYVVWLEFYQFFHIINFYGNLSWIYDYDEFIWNLEIEFRRTRMVNNYTTVCLLAKFWHLIFIFVFWVFFILRVNEIGRVRYALLAANLQNFIIMYILAWLYMFPWLKFFIRGYMDVTYYWFFTNTRNIVIRSFFNDIKIFLFSIFYNVFDYNFLLFSFKNNSFFYWIEVSEQVDFNQFRKHIIKDYIISNLN